MCGICGIGGRDPEMRPIEAQALQAMTDVIEHRGPDDDGHYLKPGVALGMRRLSIIDLPGSSQPLGNEDGSLQTVFNGEIYNFPQLRDELVGKGHDLRTRGDTETIVHLYEEHGPRFPERLRGMFAIALWDSRARRLVLTRDRMGVKPLYIAEGPFGLAFASEVKSLIAGGLVEPALDPIGAELFMAYGYVPAPHTLFAGVRKVMPASVLVCENGRVIEETEYWDPWVGARPAAPNGSWQGDQEQLLRLLTDAVEARMISDVPLGVMLSGGLDSSLITALMASASSQPVKTFSIGFEEDGDANELDDARLVAERLGTDHHAITTRAADHPELLDRALWHMEEPQAELSNLGFMLLSQLARERVTVALSGQGADELLGGYRKHQIAWLAGLVGRSPGALRRVLAAAGARAPAGSTVERGLRALTTLDPEDRLLAMSRVIQPEERLDLFTPEFRQRDAESYISAAIARRLDHRELGILGQTLYLDSRLALPDHMLLYFDKMSMAASLEVRVPFMDHDLVSFCFSLPDSRRIWWFRRKELLRRAARGLVPDQIIEKKKRGFFRSALGAWIRAHREDMFRETLLDERALGRGLYKAEGIRPLLDAAGETGVKADQRLFCLLLLEKWQRYWVDADAPGKRAARMVRAR